MAGLVQAGCRRVAAQIGASSRSRGSTALAEDTVVNHPRGLSRGQGAEWLRLEQRECEGKLRSYTLLEAETLIIVNHMVRLAGLRFSPGPGGPADRQLRSAREKLYYIGLQTHYSLEACCSEDQSY